MRTETTNIYKFEELSKDSQNKAINGFRNSEHYLSYDWWEYTIDYWKASLNLLGFKNTEVRFSGFWSQGDGASFTCDYINKEEIINTIIMSDLCSVSTAENYLKKFNNAESFLFEFHFCIEKSSSRYVHENTCFVNYENGGSEYWSNIADELTISIESLRLILCDKIYKDLKNEYEYLMSRAAIIEHIGANDYEFTSDGELH